MLHWDRLENSMQEHVEGEKSGVVSKEHFHSWVRKFGNVGLFIVRGQLLKWSLINFEPVFPFKALIFAQPIVRVASRSSTLNSYGFFKASYGYLNERIEVSYGQTYMIIIRLHLPFQFLNQLVVKHHWSAVTLMLFAYPTLGNEIMHSLKMH